MENLDILIVSPVTHNWQAFATWFSVHKLLPEANVLVNIVRGKETPFQFFQWAKRLNVPLVYSNREFDDDFSNLLAVAINTMKYRRNPDLLILTPLTMMIRPFEQPESSFLANDQAMFIKGASTAILETCLNIQQLNNSTEIDALCQEAKDIEEPLSIVSYRKGCGRWIHKLKGCPFSNAAGLATEEMTTNERRIIELWKQAVPLYNATA